MASRRRIVFWSLVVASFLVLTALSDVRAVGSRQPQISPAAPKPVETLTPQVYLPLVKRTYSQVCADYLDEISHATYEGILAMVEPSTGLPHDRFDGSLFDIMPQFAVVRRTPYTSTAPGASLESWRCTAAECRHSGDYGLKLTYSMPPGMWGSYNVDSRGFDVSQAAYLEAWVQGARGGEKFEFVLWSDCQGGFPGRPLSAEISATTDWQRKRIPLEDFQPSVDPSSLCRLSIGFNDAMHPGGTIYLDDMAFVDDGGDRVHVPLDEETNVTNIGLYIASLLAGLDLGLESYADVTESLSTTLKSIEALQTWHGFPQTHNHVVSLSPSVGDDCISTVDLGNFAAGLILLRQRVPELSSRASALIDAMQWDWLYDNSAGLPYGCRYPDGSASDDWHYDWLAADSRLAHFIAVGTELVPAGSWGNLNREHERPRCVDPELWHFAPGWDGGGLFMPLLPASLLDEAGSELGTSACNFVEDQVCHHEKIGAPAWGWSATALPPHGEEYCGYGWMRDDILVPHASVLAADCAGSVALCQNLWALEELGMRRLATDGAAAFDYGFRASVNWQTGEVATVYLVLDQAMSFLSVVNHQLNGRIREAFCEDEITQRAIDLIPDYGNSCAN